MLHHGPCRTFLFARFLRTTLYALAWLGLGGTLRADEYWDDFRVPQDTINLEGLSLPRTVADLKTQYPAAKSDSTGLDDKIGLTCFEVEGLKDADAARFYYFDGNLYQTTINYTPSRVEALGGMAAVVRKLVTSLGPADRIYANRWTWWITSNRRADFYASTTGGQFVITDTTLANLVDQRAKTTTLTGDVELGL